MIPLVIVDTNVLVAGLLTGRKDSPTAALLDAMLDGSLIFLLSQDLLSEYRAVLLRPRIQERHGLSEQEIDSLLAEITANAIWRETQPVNDTPPDTNDAHLWSLLACDPNSILVTGDEVLLKNSPKGRVLLKPADYASIKSG
jgi:uncharacterized protein